MRLFPRFAAALCCASLFAFPANAGGMHQTHDGFVLGATASGHAPIGVMGDHMHKQGEWMVSYRFMHMSMNSMRDGTNDLTSDQILNVSAANPTDYTITPTKMHSQMHMIGGMYAPNDNLTLMAMIGYGEKEMDHITDADVQFTTTASGLTDLKLTGLYRLYDTRTHHWHANFGVSLPTGSTDEVDATPMMPGGMRLPFGMQLGSGTLDLLPGITYSGHHGEWSWGGQYSAVLRMGDNGEDYRLGHQHSLQTWGAYAWAPWINSSLRLIATQSGDVDGAAIMNNPTMNPSFDPENYGGNRLDLSFGINLLGQYGALKGHRLGIEVTAPVYEDLNGPQMSMDWMAMLGWQKAF